MVRRRVHALALAAALAPAATAAQRVIELAPPDAAKACDLAAEAIATLGSDDDPVGFGALAELLVLPRGGYLVASPTFDGEIAHYDAVGRFAGMINRRGSGPGEFEGMPLLALGPGDSIHAIAAGRGDHAVFAPDLTFARAEQLEARVQHFAVMRSGMLFAAAPRYVEGSATALRIFDTQGGTAAAFDPVQLRQDNAAASRRYVAIDSAGGLWSTKISRYEVTLHDSAGAARMTLHGDRRWPDEAIPMRLDLRSEKPPGQIAGLMTDPAGYVWIFAVIASAEWKPTDTGPIDPATIYDTVIEAIDPAAGRVVGHCRLNGIVQPAADGIAYRIVHVESGDARIEVVRLTPPG